MSAVNRRARAHGFPAADNNPLTAVPWTAAYWADDPLWSNPGNGGAVASWRDGTGNGYTLTEATNRPTFRTAVTALGGRQGVEFDGVNDLLSNATPVLTQPHTTILVLDIVALGSANKVASDAVTPGAATVYWLNSNKRWTMYGGGSALSLTSPLAATGLNAVRATFNNTTSVLSNNGTTTTGTIAGSTGYTGITLGAQRPSAALWSNVRIGFAGFYPGNITTHRNWPRLKAILNGFYGATLT